LSLAAIDELWMQHIDRMAHLREEVAFEWYAQKNPLVVYKERAYDHFVGMIHTIEHRVVKWLLTARANESIDTVNLEETLLSSYLENAEATRESEDNANPTAPISLLHSEHTSPERIRLENNTNHTIPTAGRNDPCPCGSGKKYKQCHGK
jgi:preprotein translocase subunit SecA